MKTIQFFIISFSLILLYSCGGGGGEKPLASADQGTIDKGGASIPVLQNTKVRKAKLSFSLTEVIQKGDQLDMVIMMTNNKEDAKVNYAQKELALTDQNGNIYKASKASINGVEQFKGESSQTTIKKDEKVKTVVSFKGIQEDASQGKLFFKGQILRDKPLDFEVNFKKIPLKK